MAFSNQGSRPNYASTLERIKLAPMPYIDGAHLQWTVGMASSVDSSGKLTLDCI